MSPSSYVWEAPGGALSIHFALELVQQLGLEALEAYKAVPRRGLEIGGILLGRTASSGGSTTIYIEGYERVESEHRSGPSFRLSESDLERLDHLLQKHPRRVGVYRTQTRAETLAIESDDASWFERCCAGLDGVFLLIQPALGTAAVFLRRDGKLVREHEFPFRAGELAAEAIVEHEADEAAVEPTADTPHQPRLSAARTRQTLQQRDWCWQVAAVLFGAVVGAALWAHFRPRVAPPPVERARTSTEVRPAATPSRGIGLHVQREGRALHLSWDPVRNATHGTLYIQDGTHHSQLELDQMELRVGTLSYWPETQDVVFQLEVPEANETKHGAIRVVGGMPTPQVTLPRRAPAAAASPTSTSEARTAAPVLPVSEPAPKLPQPRPEPQQGSAARADTSEAKPSPFVAPAAPAPAAPKYTPAPVPKETKAADYVSVSSEPVTSSFFGRVVHKIPLIRRLQKQKEAFAPPKPVRQVEPVLSAQEQRSLTDEVPIAVKVYVTETGKVDYAEVLSRASGSNSPFAMAAVYAARRWSFTPARLGEENVPGEVILHFDFRPPAVERN